LDLKIKKILNICAAIFRSYSVDKIRNILYSKIINNFASFTYVPNVIFKAVIINREVNNPNFNCIFNKNLRSATQTLFIYYLKIVNFC